MSSFFKSVSTDRFGEKESTNMPECFFQGATMVDHGSAVRANVSTQNYTEVPRFWYLDVSFECTECGCDFTWRAEEQRVWFEILHLWVHAYPQTCRLCSAQKRGVKALKKNYDGDIAAEQEYASAEEKDRIAGIVANLSDAGDQIRLNLLSRFSSGELSDPFGEIDPRNMHRYFFTGATKLDYGSAMRADVSKQHYVVGPRFWYIDAFFKCAQCASDFVWTAEEQLAWFEVYHFWVGSQPRLCRTCSARKRNLKALRQEYDGNVAAARNQGSLELKTRIIGIVAELQQAGEKIPEAMQTTAETFARQIARGR